MSRFLLVLVCVALVLLALWGMRVGWRNRMARQRDLLPLPVPPSDLGAEQLRSTGLYVGTTFAGSWQDRVLHERLGERAAADAVLHDAGLVIDREGSDAIFLPAPAWVGARLAPALAGKDMGEGGLLVVRWRLGEAELDTGFRADDKSNYPKWVQEINKRVGR